MSPVVNILAVDDHPENTLALSAMLEAPGHRIVEAHSGEEALMCLLREDFAFVLLDVRMPGMDGFEVAALMRMREKTRFIPIIFLTGEALDLGSMYRGYTAGAVDYLMKPLDPVIVRAKVAVFAELFQQREQIREQAEQLAQAERRERDLAIADLKLTSERREKALLAEALRIRDEFLALAAHELKTPLTPLLWHVERLLRSAREDRLEPGRAIRGLEVAVHQIHRLTRLVDQLLDVTGIQSGLLGLSPEEVDLSELAREVVARCAGEATGTVSEVSLSAPEPVIGRWDRARIEQVITNLVTNAIKFGAGRPVHVSVTAMRDAVPADGDAAPAERGWALITVQDHGIGIAEADVERIFDRFERAVSVQHYGGLGLGLYILRRIVEAHGGTVDVKSRPGDGATFTVKLPLQPPGP